MIGDGGPTQFSVGGSDPFNQLLEQVRGAAEGVYDILGEMGRSRSGNVVYLARELESAHLVALKLTRSGGTNEYALEVVRTLDSAVPGLESSCPECKAVLPDWDRFCFQCGADLSTGGAPSVEETGALLDAVKEATAGAYEILGQMTRADGGGPVFFARDTQRGGKLVALRLRRDTAAPAGQEAYSIGETQVLRPLAAELGQTQVLGASALLPQAAVRPPVARAAGSGPTPAAAPAAPPEPARTARAATGGRAPWFRRVPPRVLWGAVGGLGVLVVAALALSGGEEVPVPPPPSVPDTVAGPVAGTDTLGADSASIETPPPPPPPVVAAADSATIRVTVDLPAGAVFTVNGATVRGRSIRVVAGTHTLSVLKAGTPPVTARVTLQPDQVFRWAPALPQDVVAAPPPAPRPPPPPPPTCTRAFSRSDWSLARDLCLTEAEAGSREAQRMMGRMRELGNGLQQDVAQAAGWYLRAGAAGDAEAQRRLGYLYRAGTGVRRDEKESARWFGLAAQQGDAIGQLEYGVAVEEGKGVPKSEAEAASWYQKAGDGGSGAALRRLGRLYERGRGVSKNEAEAARLYEQAAGRGDVEAMYLLGRAYKDGRGVEKSAPKALEWFQKAASAGHRDAAEEARKLDRPD